MKQTYQPKKRQRSKVHGFRKRMKTRSGKNVLKRRRNKGRHKLSAQGSYDPWLQVKKRKRFQSSFQ